MGDHWLWFLGPTKHPCNDPEAVKNGLFPHVSSATGSSARANNTEAYLSLGVVKLAVDLHGSRDLSASRMEVSE